MAAKKNSTELALMDSFKIANRYEGIDPELMAELQDELGDLDPESGITCRQIKVPSGGGLAFEVQGEDEGDAEPMKEIDGVILFTHRLSAYWPGSFGSASNPEDKIPTCSSMDGKTGIVQAGDRSGEIITCETCPYNQYGTGVDEKGNPSRGKACKNMRRIYLMMDGDPNFYLLSVPPTSIKDVNKQLAKILASGVPYTGMIISTRETEEVRSKLLRLGISQVSGGSRTSVGGYTEEERPHDTEQFDVSDQRTLDEVVCWLMENGHIPSFCTACYREGRTGDRFMSLCKSGQILNCCHPNALMTLSEYLEDYASEKTREVGYKMVEEELKRIPKDKVREIAEQNIKDIKNSNRRDFRF